MKKRVVSLMLTMAMGIVLLAGCGKTDEKANASNSETKKEESKAEDKKEDKKEDPVPVKIIYAGSAGEDDIKQILEKLNPITEEEIGVTVDIQVMSWGDLGEKVPMMLQAGEDSFDLCYTSNWLNHLDLNGKNGAFLDIEDLLKEYAPTLWASKSEAIWASGRVDGTLYAVPYTDYASGAWGLLFKKELVEKYDFDVTSVDSVADPDLDAYLQLIKDNEPDMIPVRNSVVWPYKYLEPKESGWDTQSRGETMLISENRDAYYYDFNRMGVYVKADDESMTINKWTMEEMISLQTEVNEWLRDWYDRGIIRSDIMTCDTDTADELAGLYAVTYLGVSEGSGDGSINVIGEDEYIMRRVTPPISTPVNAQAGMLAVNQASKNPEAAIKLLELIHTNQEVYRLMTSGVEDVHYTVDENGLAKAVAGSTLAWEAWAITSAPDESIRWPMDEKTVETQKYLKEECFDSRFATFAFSLEGEGMEDRKKAYEDAKLYIQDIMNKYPNIEYLSKDVAGDTRKMVEELWPYYEVCQNEMARQLEEYIAGLK